MLRDVEWGLSCTDTIDSYVVTLRNKVKEAAEPGNLIFRTQDFKRIESCLRKMIFACMHEPDRSKEPADLTIDEFSVIPIVSMQTLFREIKLLDSLVWALGAPESLDITGNMLHTPEFKPLLHISQLLYKLVTLTFLGSRRNEIYLATRIATPTDIPPHHMTSTMQDVAKRKKIEHVLTFIEHVIDEVGDEIGAEDCLRTLGGNSQKSASYDTYYLN
jgi:hypothetical protein